MRNILPEKNNASACMHQTQKQVGNSLLDAMRFRSASRFIAIAQAWPRSGYRRRWLHCRCSWSRKWAAGKRAHMLKNTFFLTS